ncbi:hypothetical protein [Demequina sp.]|uniref:TolB family protein n=1 Tax=Demequina sp. TaxID=2050685 RepID=UPI003D0C1E61
MSDEEVTVEPATARSWKRTVRQPKVWIPSVVGAVVVTGVVVAAASAGGGAPLASPSVTPSASSSTATSATALPSSTPSAVVSEPATPMPSVSPSSEPSQSEGAEEARWEQAYELAHEVDSVTPVWSPDSHYVAITAGVLDIAGRANVMIVDTVAGSEVWMEFCGYPLAWSHTGNRLAVMGCDEHNRVLRVVNATSTTNKIYEFTDMDQATAVAWSADDKAIILAEGPSWHANGSSIIGVNLATGKQTTIDAGGLLTMSASGDRMAYWADEDGDGHATALVVSRPDGSKREVLVPESEEAAPLQNRAPQWAPDGSAIAYQYDRANGTTDWMVRDLASGATQQVTGINKPAGYGQIRWSPDGQRLFISSGKTAWVVSRQGDLHAKSKIRYQAYPETAWGPDGDSVYVSYHATKPSELWHLESEAGSNQDWLEPFEGNSEYEADAAPTYSPDGTKYMWTGYAPPSLALTVFVNVPY